MSLARIQTSIIKNLNQLGRLTDEQAQEIIETPEELSGKELESLLLKGYDLTDFELLVAKSRAFNLNPFNARRFRQDERTYEVVDKEFCRENKVLPVGNLGNSLVVAIGDPFNIQITNKIQEIAKKKVTVLLALESEIESILEDDEEESPAGPGLGDVVEALGLEFDFDDVDIDGDELEEESAPIIQLANRIIEDAYFSRGSDVHIEPFENETRVRVRIDGVCQEKLSLPKKVAAALIARLKVMSNLDIAEKRLPQDGRIVFKQFNKRGINIDLRISTAPLNHGEGAVMRVLDKEKSTLPLQALGFSDENFAAYRKLIARPHGMILHCGPTGSGKSMTLYSALNEINQPGVCVRTAEDPIEYTLPGLCQMQMNRKIGLTFATALRSFLRQDPDIILVGEIRDKETAGIAVEAALTGHMLFSTLHTNDAPSTVSRLTDMGIERFMISASLVCVCAQRLIRRICSTCRKSYAPSGNEVEIMRNALDWEGEIYKASRTGCPNCERTGMKGRIGIHELLSTSEELVDAINHGRETAEIKKIAVAKGMRTLHQDSIMKVREGFTSMEATVPPDLEDLRAAGGRAG